MKANVIDLFSGCGGLTDGFLQAGGYNTLAAVDWEFPTVDTLRKRLSDKWGYEQASQKVICFDMQKTESLIHGWDDSAYGKSCGIKELVGSNKVDVVIGGPPCQAYSIAGRIRDKNGMHDDYRNYLFESYIKVVKTFQPKVCIFENVQGMLSAAPGGVSIIERISNDFNDAGYYISEELREVALFNTSDFGVPQKRLRVIVVAVNKNQCKDYKDMVNEFYLKLNSLKISTVETVNKAIEDLPRILPLDNPKSRVSHYVEHEALNVSDHKPRFHNNRDVGIFRLLANDIQSGQNKYTHSEQLKALYTEKTGKVSSVHKYHVLRGDSPSNTIPAHLYKDGLRHIHPDPEQARSITVREAARLQTFDDDYVFLGSNGAKYKMIGNAVPPKFAKLIALSVKDVLTKE